MTQISNLFRMSSSGTVAPSEAEGLVNSTYMVGMEFELEDVGRGGEGEIEVPNGYDVHSDASLRNGLEFVFDGPAYGSGVLRRINSMSDFLEDRNYSTSERTSTHIHLNMRDMAATVEKARCMFGLVYLIEPAIFRFADENRKWCGYCQPLTDMPQQRIGDIISGEDDLFLSGAQGQQHNDKYFGFNLKSLSRHGTIEFRYFPGWSGSEDALSWVNLVMEIREAVTCFNDLPDMLSVASNAQALRAILAEAMPKSYARLAGLVEDVEIERRAGFLAALREVHLIQPPSVPSRLSSVQADSTMAALLAAITDVNVSRDSRAVAALTDIISSGALDNDLLGDLRQVLSATTSSEFVRMFEEAVRQSR